MVTEFILSEQQQKPYLNLGGTHRARAISETLEIAQSIAKEIGITRVANITGLDSIGIPVVIAIRPNSKLLSVSQGKGMTLELAKVSAIMESIESWHAENMPLPDLKGSYDKLSQDLSQSCIFINPCHVAHSIFDLNPLREMTLHWCSGINLVNNQIAYIPYEAISLDSIILSEANLLFGASSNGLASGNTVAEATCHALCELIERDADSKFNHLSDEEQQKRLVNLRSINSQYAQTILEKIQQASVTVQIWDMTSEIDLPVFCCTLYDHDIGRKTQIFSGQGCHFDKEVALCRAITEAVQTRLTFIAGSRDDVFPSYYEKELLTNQSVIQEGVRQYDKISQPAYSHDFECNVKMIVDKLVVRGFEKIIVINHTREAYPIAVVSVIVPNLCGKDD